MVVRILSKISTIAENIPLTTPSGRHPSLCAGAARWPCAASPTSYLWPSPAHGIFMSSPFATTHTSLYKRGGAISETPTVNVFRSGQVFLSSLWGWVTLSNRFVGPSEVEKALANATVEVSFTIHHTYIKNKDESVEQDSFKAKIEQLLVHIEKKNTSTVVSNPSLPTNP